MAGWKFAFASVIGNSHIGADIPCQDYCHVDDFGDFTISVVCDGAGSCHNAHHGARQVAQSCSYRFATVVKANKWQQEATLPELAAWQKAAKQTLHAVKEDLENYSLETELPFKSLACTVIIVVTLPGGLLVTHIGDGRAGYLDEGGEWKAMITPFHGTEANETVFITSGIWDDELTDHYLASNVIAGKIKAFCLMSDGCEKAAFECNLYDSERDVYYDPNRPYPLFFQSNVSIIPTLYKNGMSQEDVNAGWATFLTAGNDKLKTEPDDKTLILGVCVDETM